MYLQVFILLAYRLLFVSPSTTIRTDNYNDDILEDSHSNADEPTEQKFRKFMRADELNFSQSDVPLHNEEINRPMHVIVNNVYYFTPASDSWSNANIQNDEPSLNNIFDIKKYLGMQLFGLLNKRNYKQHNFVQYSQPSEAVSHSAHTVCKSNAICLSQCQNKSILISTDKNPVFPTFRQNLSSNSLFKQASKRVHRFVQSNDREKSTVKHLHFVPHYTREKPEHLKKKSNIKAVRSVSRNTHNIKVKPENLYNFNRYDLVYKDQPNTSKVDDNEKITKVPRFFFKKNPSLFDAFLADWQLFLSRPSILRKLNCKNKL